MIKIEYSHPRKLHEIHTVHSDIKTLVQNIGVSQKMKVKNVTINFNPVTIAFIDYLNANNQQVLDGLLQSKPDVLANIYIKDIEAHFPDFAIDKAKVGKRNQVYSEVREVAYAIFVTHGYEKLQKKAEFYGALDVKVCPYCNRTLIEPIDDGNGKKTAVGELDHFYCKSRYPYLAISLYNLVPSCGICNGKSRKGEKDLYRTAFQNPYLLTNNDGMSFGFRPTKTAPADYDESFKKYHILYDFTPNIMLKYNFDILKLKKIYSGNLYRGYVTVIESAVRDFCNKSYVDDQIHKFQMMGFKVTYASLLKDRLSVTPNKSEYSHHVNNKFVMDIFTKMLTHIKGTIQIK